MLEKNCFITKDLEENNKKIRFMYKEEPNNINDSGWRFFSGDEEQDYVDDASNILLVKVSYVLNNIDKSIEKYLDSSVGSAFERNNVEDEFIDSDFSFKPE